MECGWRGLQSTSRLQTAGSGTIDVKEMHSALCSMGHNPTDEELFAIIHEVGATYPAPAQGYS